jgi:hypothetical protein
MNQQIDTSSRMINENTVAVTNSTNAIAANANMIQTSTESITHSQHMIDMTTDSIAQIRNEIEGFAKLLPGNSLKFGAFLLTALILLPSILMGISLKRFEKKLTLLLKPSKKKK